MGLQFNLNKEVEIYGTLNSLDDWKTLARFSRRENLDYRFQAGPGEDLKPRSGTSLKPSLRTKRRLKSTGKISLRHSSLKEAIHSLTAFF